MKVKQSELAQLVPFEQITPKKHHLPNFAFQDSVSFTSTLILFTFGYNELFRFYTTPR